MRTLLRTIHIAALACLASAFQPVAAQPLGRLSLAELETAIDEGGLGKVSALAAEQGGQIVYRKRFDNKDDGHRIDIRSAGKSLTALAIGLAIEDGSLAGTDVKVWPLLGAERGEPFNSISVADLLGMSSALECNDWDRGSPGQEERMYRTRNWREFALDLPAREYSRDARGEGSFSYCTAGVFLLGQVVEAATGERFDAYVQRRLFDPLGIDGADWRYSRSGEVQSGGQLTISDAALLKIGRMVLDRGSWEGQQVIPSSWIGAMLTRRHQLGQHVWYGNLWWAIPVPSPRGYEGAWMMKGNGGNIVALVPSYDAVLVVQARNYNREEAERHAFTALAAMLAEMEPVLPATAE